MMPKIQVLSSFFQEALDPGVVARGALAAGCAGRLVSA
jgi:hypothetical protein